MILDTKLIRVDYWWKKRPCEWYVQLFLRWEFGTARTWNDDGTLIVRRWWLPLKLFRDEEGVLRRREYWTNDKGT